MNEQVKQQLIQWVQSVTEAARSAEQWSAEQVPLLVQEWLRWQLIEALFIALTLLATTGVVWFASHRICQAIRKTNSDPFIPDLVTTVTGFITIPLVGAVVNQILAALKVWLAPRVVVLEKFADLIK